MNRCRRCNREISDPNAMYGWRCAEILGVSETLSEMGDDVFDKFMDGVIKAQSLLGEDNAEFSERQRKSLYSAYAKMSLWDGVDDKKVKEAKKESYSIFSSGKTKAKSLADELNEYKDYIEKQGVISGNSKNTKKTKNSNLNSLSNLLTAASLIPGLDTFTNIVSIPVDLARGDYVSAGLSALGAIPFVGEFADVAKYADKGIDAVRTADKVSDIGKSVVKVPKLPKTPSNLKNTGWKETTSAAMKKNTTSRTFKKDGITIRFDKGKSDTGGYGGKDHYHILNPKSTGKHDYYLDKYGNPVSKNSKASHILP